MKKTSITSVQSTAGFLENCEIVFSKGLTCVIGARGTCKSTLVESIRFVFDANESRVKTLLGKGTSTGESSFGMIETTLRAGSIKANLDSTDGSHESTLAIEREADGEPRLFHDGVREHASTGEFSQIEVFSQGDLQRIAADQGDALRIDLIDRRNSLRINELRNQRRTLASRLREISLTLRKHRAHISSIEQEIKPAPQLAEALKRAVAEAPPLSAEIETERQGFDARTRTVEASDLAIQAIQDAAAYLASAPDYVARISESISTMAEQKQPEAQSLVDKLENAKKSLQLAFLAAKQIPTDALATEFNVLKRAFETNNEPFFRLRKQQSDVNESLKKQQHLRRQVEHMQKLDRDLLSAQDDAKSLLKKRAEIRADISTIDDTILEIRTNEIKSINDDHGDFVYLTLKQGTGSSSYSSRLENLLKQSKVRGQDEIAKGLAARFEPHELIDLIEAGDSQTLAKSLDRDVAQMTRVISHLADHSDLHDIESEPPAAHLEITMYDGGQAKPIETLSKGQKATALLPLILRPLPYPLILDQPEDDLDNSFIITYLVKTITRLKLSRQLIFITHNANIPVLGDADHVVVMGMKTPTQAIVRKSGTVDECKREILDLLEGGATAFLQREVRYGDLLTGVSDDE